MKIFLLGFMGTGKTYWGRRWSEQQQMRFFDLDTEIEKKSGVTIPILFDQFGEDFFREKEKETLHSFEKEDHLILSTGGGTPCFYDNMLWMNKNGLTIYLDSPPEVLKRRLLDEKEHRPLIRQLDEKALDNYIKNKLQERNKFYFQAQIILPAESISDTTFNEIKNKYV